MVRWRRRCRGGSVADLDGICYFVARYNNIVNPKSLGFDENADICPIERYENQMGLSK